MENRKTIIGVTVFITTFFFVLIMSNYALISYYSTNYSHSEIGKVKELRNYKLKRSSNSVLEIQLSDKNIISSKINNYSINQFYTGMQVKVDVYKNIFGDYFYVESNNGELDQSGPTLAFIFDSLFFLIIFLITSDNISHRKKVGKENVEKMDNEFKTILIISIFISVSLSILILFLKR
jgi:hypothetical protein